MKHGIRVIVGVFIFLAGLLLAPTSFASTDPQPARQTTPTKPWHVTELKQEGFSRCGEGTWMFDISWKPILQGVTPWLKYQVSGYKCTQSKYECTTERCNAQIWGCSTGQPKTWAGVTADFGKRISGIRLGTIFMPPSCGL